MYLKKYRNSELSVGPSDQVIDQDEFEHQAWTSSKFVHVSGKEYLTPNMSAPSGLFFVAMEGSDADHAGDIVTRRYRKENIIDVNSALVYWISK